MDPLPYTLTVIGPALHLRKGRQTCAVVCQPRRHEARVVGPTIHVWVVGQDYPQKAASAVPERITKAGSDFPIDVLSLPGALANQHDGDRSFSYELVPNTLPNGIRLDVEIVNVTIFNRPVDDVAFHHPSELVLVVLVFVVVADEDLVPWCSVQQCLLTLQVSQILYTRDEGEHSVVVAEIIL